MQNLVIVGGGFAGTWSAMSAAATRAANAASEMTISLVSQSDNLCIRPRLYEGAQDSMLVPLKPLMDEIDVTLITDSVEAVEGQTLRMRSGADVDFDSMILAAGSSVKLPGCKGATQFGFWVDDFESTRKLDEHLKTLDTTDDADRTVVVVGSSFSGIEIVTKLRQRLGEAFQLVLIDRNEQPGSSVGETLKSSVQSALEDANVKFRGNTSLQEITASQAILSDGEAIRSSSVIFATGFRANSLTAHLSHDTDPMGRLMVDETLRVACETSIFAAGDVASAMVDMDHRSLMSCQHAMPMGIAAGRNAVLDLLDLEPVAYSQPFYATCIDLGQSGAVFTNGWERSIIKSGPEGAEMKQQINTQWIYPPQPALGREKIFAMIRKS
ncbi:NAD(P)/FAD-dependent oxidoreductase [Hoeflea alexandrii]